MTKLQNDKIGRSVEVLVAGDICPDTCGYNKGTGKLLAQGPEKVFGRLAGYISSSDISVANLEAPLLGRGKPIIKCGPNLKASPAFARAMRLSGFNVANLANNHIKDFGQAGVVKTVDELKKQAIPYFGAGETPQKAASPLFMKRKGMKIGFLAFGENEFGNADADGWGGASIDLIDNGPVIRAAAAKCDALLVFVHGGVEYCPIPAPGAMKRYRHYADCGAAAVIVSHAHVPLGWEVYNNVPIFYSLGNFSFPWPGTKLETWDCGLAVRLFLTKGKRAQFEVMPTRSVSGELGADIMPDARRGAYEKYLKSLCEVLRQPERLRRLWDAWCVQRGVRVMKNISNFAVSSMTSAEDLAGMAMMENLIRCESHNELLINFLGIARKGRIRQAEKYIPELDSLKEF